MKRWFRAAVLFLFAVVSAYYVFRFRGPLDSFISIGKLCFYIAGVLCNLIHAIRLLRGQCSESLNFLNDACTILDFLITLLFLSDFLLWVGTVVSSSQS